MCFHYHIFPRKCAWKACYPILFAQGEIPRVEGSIWTDAWVCLHYWGVIWVTGYFNCPGSASLGNLKRYSFCLFVVVSQSLWRRVGWELPGYFGLIFHICVTRFTNSVTHEVSVAIRFILCETIMACFLLGRLFNSLTARIVLVGQFWYIGSC